MTRSSPPTLPIVPLTPMTARIVDANLNRLCEGLRVVEDAVRFGLDDAHLAARLKALRREAARWRARRGAELLMGRDSRRDVGREQVAEPTRRADALEVVEAAFGRATEALRSIEEWSKLSDPELARRAKAMRFECYDLQREVSPRLNRARRAARLHGLYLILTDPAAGYEAAVRAAVAVGAAAIQLRAKGLPDRELAALARRLRAMVTGSRTLFIVNDRPDIARLAQADGVHLGQDDLSVADARAIVGEWALVGKSTHTLAELRRALAERPDYVAIGPLFPTASKPDAAPTLGLDRARRLLARVPERMPAIAIGGIDETNVAEVVRSGFAAYAVLGRAGRERRPRAVLERLRRIERSARQS